MTFTLFLINLLIGLVAFFPPAFFYQWVEKFNQDKEINLWHLVNIGCYFVVYVFFPLVIIFLSIFSHYTFTSLCPSFFSIALLEIVKKVYSKTRFRLYYPVFLQNHLEHNDLLADEAVWQYFESFMKNTHTIKQAYCTISRQCQRNTVQFRNFTRLYQCYVFGEALQIKLSQKAALQKKFKI